MNRFNAFSVFCLLFVLWGIAALFFATADAQDEKRISYNRDVRPILSDNCFQCHGPDSHQRKADLRLDVASSAHAVLEKGNPDESELVRRITSDDTDEKMPSIESGKKLTAQQIELLKQWIKQGAEYEKHWSFITPQWPAIPPVKNADWPQNEIDYFVLAKLEAQGLQPSPKADKETLIRRVTYDLTGLPPTLPEIDAFLQDGSKNAFEKVVDRLLQSPRHAEHMARYWLDLARYADTNGYQYDTERTQWPWRDWVIRAYLDNMPFDQFTIQQLAGDLLPNATDLQKLATGFNRNHGITIEGGVIDEEYRTEYVIDRINTTTTVWLGLTFGCARCHDHKFDPITQKDFYQFFAFFNQVPERGLNGFEPQMAAPLALQKSDLAELEAAVVDAQKQYEAAIAGLQDKLPEWEVQARNELKQQWQVVEPMSVKSSGGATLVRQDDGSYLATEKNPAQDEYEVVFHPPHDSISAIRLDALGHESFTPQYGFARSVNGNFVMTNFVVEVAERGSPDIKPVKIAEAKADFSQANYPITAAIDGDPKSGWGIAEGPDKSRRQAVFTFAESIPVNEKTLIRVRIMHHAMYANHNIGRFRLSATAEKKPQLVKADDLALEVPAKQRSQEQAAALRDFLIDRYGSDEIKYLKHQWQESIKRKNELAAGAPKTMVMLERANMRETFVLDRGQYDQPREKVTAGVPASLTPLPDGAPANRLGMAQWMVAADNPLTARVAVNRYWQRYFGTGLVKTGEDFGLQGEFPSHPDLLDWLAREFVEGGWNMRAIQKLIVMSATYQQSSRVTDQLLQIDPLNRLFTRGPRVRFDAEVVRDSALAASGLLVERLGGPSVYPYHPQGLWMEINNRPGYSKEYAEDTGDKLYRRSMYTFWKRTVPPPSMATFDAPEREYCVVRRSVTNTPLQAFVLLHDPQFVEAARQLGARMIKEGGESVDSRIVYGFRLVTGRHPNDQEIAVLKRTYAQRVKLYESDPEQARKLLSVGESPADHRLQLTEAAAWAAVGRLLLNLSETITKG